MEKNNVGAIIDKAFEEIALVLGGIFAVHGVHDEAVWQIMKHIDMVHENVLTRLDGLESSADGQVTAKQEYEVHPAVEALLLKIRKRNSHGGDES